MDGWILLKRLTAHTYLIKIIILIIFNSKWYLETSIVCGLFIVNMTKLGAIYHIFKNEKMLMGSFFLTVSRAFM